MDNCEVCGKEWVEFANNPYTLWHACTKDKPKPDEAPAEWTEEKAKRLKQWVEGPGDAIFSYKLILEALAEIDRLKEALEMSESAATEEAGEADRLARQLGDIMRIVEQNK